MTTDSILTSVKIANLADKKITILTLTENFGNAENIEWAPLVNVKGLLQINKDLSKNCMLVGLALITNLDTSEQDSIVNTNIDDLCALTDLSKPTVINALKSLRLNKYIEKITVSKYYILPSLAVLTSVNNLDFSDLTSDSDDTNK